MSVDPHTPSGEEAPKIGRYEIQTPLMRGGMGMVYLAYDPYIQRQVAIKVIPLQRDADEHFRRRFRREVQAVAALEHAAIVPIYDYGEADADLYIVMRYMTGGSLAQRLQQASLSLAEAARVVERVGAALDEVHRRSILHRDVKPGNILFDPDQNAYLADFGLVKMMEGASTLTSDGILVGTPAYMSPEQVDGKLNLDGRSDIYSLGVVLFQMLAGQAPYTGTSGMSVAVKHLLEPVPDVLAYNPDLPPDIQHVIARAMAKFREERYPTAAALLDDIRCVLAGDPVEPAYPPPTGRLPRAEAGAHEPPTPPIGQVKRQPKRLPLRAIVGVGALALVLAAAAIWASINGIGGAPQPTPSGEPTRSSGGRPVLNTTSTSADPTDTPTSQSPVMGGGARPSPTAPPSATAAGSASSGGGETSGGSASGEDSSTGGDGADGGVLDGDVGGDVGGVVGDTVGGVADGVTGGLTP